MEEMGVLFLRIYCNTMKRVYIVHTFTCNSLCTLHNYRTVTCQTQVIVRITGNQWHFEKNSKYCTVFHLPWILVSGHDSINGVYNLFQHFIQLLCLLWFKPPDILYLLIKEIPLNHLKPLHQFVLNQNKDSLWLWWAKNESRIKTYLSAQLFKFWKNHIRIRNADLILIILLKDDWDAKLKWGRYTNITILTASSTEVEAEFSAMKYEGLDLLPIFSDLMVQFKYQPKANLFKDYCALGVFSFCLNLNTLITIPINSFTVTAILILLQGKLIHIKYDATAVTTCIVMSYNYLLTNTTPNYVNLPCKKSRISVILIGWVC